MKRFLLAVGIAAGVLSTSTVAGAAGTPGPQVNTWGRSFDVPRSVSIADQSPVVQAQAGNEAGYVLLTDGSVWAWGGNRQGELGDGTLTKSPAAAVQVQFPAGTFITTIGEAYDSAMAVDSDGGVWGWGNGAQGMMCGAPDSTTPELVTSLPATVVSIAGGSDHYLFLLSSGKVKACGSNVQGDLGDRSRVSSATPVSVKGLNHIVQISAGSHVSGALDSSGNVYMWGQGEYGQMGNGTFSASHVPVQVDLPAPATELSVGGSVHTNGSECALAAGVDYCWGNDAFGQLGDGGGTNSATPVALQGLPDLVSVFAGGQASYAIDGAGQVYAWGSNNSGQIGDGHRNAVMVTSPKMVDSGVKMLSTTDNTVEDYH